MRAKYYLNADVSVQWLVRRSRSWRLSSARVAGVSPVSEDDPYPRVSTLHTLLARPRTMDPPVSGSGAGLWSVYLKCEVE